MESFVNLTLTRQFRQPVVDENRCSELARNYRRTAKERSGRSRPPHDRTGPERAPGQLLERDTKTHRARVVQVPTSVLRELRTHLDASSTTTRKHCSSRACGIPGSDRQLAPPGVAAGRQRHRIARLGHALRPTAYGGESDGATRGPCLGGCGGARPRPGNVPQALRPPVSGGLASGRRCDRRHSVRGHDRADELP